MRREAAIAALTLTFATCARAGDFVQGPKLVGTGASGTANHDLLFAGGPGPRCS